MTDAWAELKHAIRVYHHMTQGPSESLCKRLMKLPDFIDDIRQGRDPSAEMRELAYILVKEVGLGVLGLADQLSDPPGPAGAIRLRHTLEWAETADRETAKRLVLRDTAALLAELEELTGPAYPKIPE